MPAPPSPVPGRCEVRGVVARKSMLEVALLAGLDESVGMLRKSNYESDITTVLIVLVNLKYSGSFLGGDHGPQTFVFRHTL